MESNTSLASRCIRGEAFGQQPARDSPRGYDNGAYSVPANYISTHSPTTRTWQPSPVSTGGNTSISSLLNSNTNTGSSSNNNYPYSITPALSSSETLTPEALSPVSTTTTQDHHYPAVSAIRQPGMAMTPHYPDHVDHVDAARPEMCLFAKRRASCSPGHRTTALKISIRENRMLNRGRRPPPRTTVTPSPSSSGATTPVNPAFRSDDEDAGSEPFDNVSLQSGELGMRRALLGRPRNAVRPAPAVQRERNRVAATKCRAKTKEAISRLEEHEKAVSDRREYLSAEKAALMNEVLALRLELLRHSKCPADANIQNYLRNAAIMIGQTGGTHPIWGPDGSGRLWPVGHGHHHHGSREKC